MKTKVIKRDYSGKEYPIWISKKWAVYERSQDGLLKHPEYDYGSKPFSYGYSTLEEAWADILKVAEHENVGGLIIVEEVSVSYYETDEE